MDNEPQTPAIQQGGSLADLAQSVGRATIYDRVIDASLDAVSILVPVVGPATSAALRQVIPKDRDIYERSFAVEVVRRIDRLEAGRVDPAYLHTEEWISDVEEVIEAVGSRKQRDKRRYFASALTNAATQDRPELVERKRFLGELERLRLSHIRLISVLLMPPEPLGDGSTDGYLLARMPGADLENVKLDWADPAGGRHVGPIPHRNDRDFQTAVGRRITPRARPAVRKIHRG